MTQKSRETVTQELESRCPMEKIDSISNDIVSYIRKKLLKKYSGKKPLRGFHPKTIGLVAARLIVDNNLPDNLKAGLFKEPASYDAWIRFSNCNGTVSADRKSAVRGMAIKVLNVKSDKFMDADPEGKTQDILLFTSRVSIPGPFKKQVLIPRTILGNFFEIIWANIKTLPISIRSVITFFKGYIKASSILEQKYFSATPYSFGEKVIKWHTRPLNTITSAMPSKRGPDFLRERLIKDLSNDSKDEISFGLFVQFQENEETEPVEDPSVNWKTTFHRVATITLPKQDIDTEEREKKVINISFSPGHAMQEHAPLGCVNMIRRKVYAQLSRERREHS